MRFSYAMLPDHPLQEPLAFVQLADEPGFRACCAADETWHKDVWLPFAAARAGPGGSASAPASPR